MKWTVRHTVDIVIAVLLAVGTACLLTASRGNRAMTTCTGLQVEMADEYRFVSQEDIEKFLRRRYGEYVGQRLDSIRLDRIEEMLETRSVVMNSEAWTSEDGLLHISITQRPPAARFQRGDRGFYMDATGYTFPLHSSYTADVPVIEGDIPPIEKGGWEDWTDGVLSLLNALEKSKTWKGCIGKMLTDADGNLTICMEGRPERFIIGQPDDLQAKLGRIDHYLKSIAPSKEEGYYKSVNVKYNSQIICRKGI